MEGEAIANKEAAIRSAVVLPEGENGAAQSQKVDRCLPALM
jgi:hypothetical protein